MYKGNPFYWKEKYNQVCYPRELQEDHSSTRKLQVFRDQLQLSKVEEYQNQLGDICQNGSNQNICNKNILFRDIHKKKGGGGIKIVSTSLKD